MFRLHLWIRIGLRHGHGLGQPMVGLRWVGLGWVGSKNLKAGMGWLGHIFLFCFENDVSMVQLL